MPTTPPPQRPPHLAADDARSSRLTRRAVLAGFAGVGGTLVLGSCTDAPTISSGGANTSVPNAAAGTTGEVNMAPRFDPQLFAVTGHEQRLVVSFLNKQGETPKDLPGSIEFTATFDDKAVGAPVKATAHADGIPVPYFPVPFTADQPGTYTLRARIGDETPSTTFNVVGPDKNPLVAVGSKLRAADTPTTTDARGVKPICTRVGKDGPNPCPLHELNLRDALAAAKPIALLISTPAFCQIGVCGPVLDLVLELRANYPGVQFIHAEVYTDPNSGSQDTAPIIETYGLNYEPALFLAKADGTVVQRLDAVFDRAEIKAGLDLLRSSP
jgi:hypothetical protein